MKGSLLITLDADTAAIMRAASEACGVPATAWVRDGGAWLPEWKRVRPTLVFVDLVLPNKDGLEISAQLMDVVAPKVSSENKVSAAPKTAVVFSHPYEGLQANSVEMRALSIGVHSVIQRPASVARWTLAVSQALALV